MTRQRLSKTNFTSGEISAELLGRGDLTAYDNGAALLRNVFILPTGGGDAAAGPALRRPAAERHRPRRGRHRRKRAERRRRRRRRRRPQRRSGDLPGNDGPDRHGQPLCRSSVGPRPAARDPVRRCGRYRAERWRGLRRVPHPILGRRLRLVGFRPGLRRERTGRVGAPAGPDRETPRSPPATGGSRASARPTFRPQPFSSPLSISGPIPAPLRPGG